MVIIIIIITENFWQYKIGKFYKAFFKSLQKEEKEKIHNLENKGKALEIKLHIDENIKLYNRHKQELDEVFNDIAEGIWIRSRCQWYEKGEKSIKFLLNFEKKKWNPKQKTKTYSKGERNIWWKKNQCRDWIIL